MRRRDPRGEIPRPPAIGFGRLPRCSSPRLDKLARYVTRTIKPNRRSARPVIRSSARRQIVVRWPSSCPPSLRRCPRSASAGNVRVAPRRPPRPCPWSGPWLAPFLWAARVSVEALIPRPERRGGGEDARLPAPNERVKRFDAACGIGRVVVWRVQAVALARRPPSPRLSGGFFSGFQVLGSPRFFKWLRLGRWDARRRGSGGESPRRASRACSRPPDGSRTLESRLSPESAAASTRPVDRPVSDVASPLLFPFSFFSDPASHGTDVASPRSAPSQVSSPRLSAWRRGGKWFMISHGNKVAPAPPRRPAQGSPPQPHH